MLITVVFCIIMYYICSKLELKTEIKFKNMKSKDESKTEALIVRVDKKMKYEISRLADDNRRELSDYLRLLFEDAIKERKKV